MFCRCWSAASSTAIHQVSFDRPRLWNHGDRQPCWVRSRGGPDWEGNVAPPQSIMVPSNYTVRLASISHRTCWQVLVRGAGVQEARASIGKQTLLKRCWTAVEIQNPRGMQLRIYCTSKFKQHIKIQYPTCQRWSLTSTYIQKYYVLPSETSHLWCAMFNPDKETGALLVWFCNKVW